MELQPRGASGSKHQGLTSRGSAAYPRKRAVTACQVCRARRTKCDQKKPACSFCAKIGAECVFEPSSLSTFDPASLAILERLERLEQKLDAQQRQNGSSFEPITYHQASSTSPPAVRDNLERPTQVPPPHVTLSDYFPKNLEGVLEWPVFRNLGYDGTPSAALLSPLSPLQVRDRSSAAAGFLGGDELDPASCNHWLDNFFTHVHIKNPVFNEERTRRLVRAVCLEGVGWDGPSCLALLVLANGALIRPFDSSSLTQRELDRPGAMSLFAAAQKRLGPILVSTGLIEAQCAFLTGVFLMSVLRPADAWRMFLQGLAICQSFSSIRNPPPVPMEGETALITSPDIVAEESIHWSCWKSEQEVRLELGSSNLGNSSYDPPRFFPSPPAGCDDRAWYFYLSEIALWRLEAEAKHEMTALVQRCASGNSQSINSTLVAALGDLGDSTLVQISAWRDSLPPLVSIKDIAQPTDEDDDVLRHCLRGRTVYMQELVSWPFIHVVINSDDQVSSAIRQRVALSLQAHLDRIVVYRSGFYHRHHGTWLMMRSTARSACILLAFAQQLEPERLMPRGWREPVEAAAQMMEYWADEAPGMSHAAGVVRHLLSLARFRR